MKKYVRKASTILKNEGALSLAIKGLQKLEKDRIKKSDSPVDKIRYISLVERQDALGADWSRRPYIPLRKKHTSPYTINWIMSPPGGGGGHQNIFRFIDYLDGQGYKNNVYIYSTFDDMTLAQAKDNVRAYCNAKGLNFYRYKGSMVAADIVFATGWETAYPVFNDKTDALKMYFIQDFEPYFYAIGTDYVLAENTYKFGFRGITAGAWLTQKLSQDYGMKSDYYDFGANSDLYKLTNMGKRKEVFFYARPVTERRGFDLGIMALEIFHQQLPEYKINLAGWDVSGYDVPFPYTNHKALKLEELSELYNKSAAGLVISLTNMSLLPLELLSCGTIPVVTDGLNNRLVSDNPYIAYTPASPRALADALINTVNKKDLHKDALLAAESVQGADWDKSCKKFEAVLQQELTHG